MRGLVIGLLAAALAGSAAAQDAAVDRGWSLAIHGGAGVIERGALTPEQDAAYRAALSRALEAGAAILDAGGSALDAVEAAVRVMEDDPLFNAGRGAVFTADGRVELDAAIMDGATLNAGAVAGLTATRHPISAARAVMEQSPHVMLIGPGADAFSASVGLEQVDPAWFFTERRWQGLLNVLRQRGEPVPRRPDGVPEPPQHGQMASAGAGRDENRFGTVGAVALDRQGRLAAATSTGGMTAKRWGRVGDVPVIGAGTYASNADGCAVSATGSGEYFIRATVARDICASMGQAYAEYDRTKTEREAFEASCLTTGERGEICSMHLFSPGRGQADAEIEQVGALGGEGGVIVMNREGRAAFSMNTSGMYRGRVSSAAAPRVAIYADEDED